ncbi:MAG: AAA family ATPase [Candidatus Helarchaeota archaeon]
MDSFLQFENKEWNPNTQKELFKILTDKGLHKPKKGTSAPDFNARKLYTHFRKVGFLYVEGGILKITKAGKIYPYVDERKRAEILTKSCEKLKFKNPTEKYMDDDFEIYPYYASLYLLLKLGHLSYEEIENYVIEIKNHDELDDVVGKIETSRTGTLSRHTDNNRHNRAVWMSSLFWETKYITKYAHGGITLDEDHKDEVAKLLDEGFEKEIILETEDIIDEDLKAPSNINDKIKEIQKILLIDNEKIKRIINNLLIGKNVILTGGTGTGKTHLAKLIPAVIFKDTLQVTSKKLIEKYQPEFELTEDEDEYMTYMGDIDLPIRDFELEDEVESEIDISYFPEIVTATSDWSSFDVIGGIFPVVDDENNLTYRIKRGCVYETIIKNLNETLLMGGMWQRSLYKHEKTMYKGVWLIIDEFNRADIDKAFGGLFTALEYKTLKIPTEKSISYKEIRIPKDYRIIGTLNTFDKHYLYTMSEALKRRFAFIEITPPSRELALKEKYIVSKKVRDQLNHLSEGEIDEIIKLNVTSEGIDDSSDEEFIKILNTLFNLMHYIRIELPLGTAQLISALKYAISSHMIFKDPLDHAIDVGISSNIVPQLEILPKIVLEDLKYFADGTIIEKMISLSKSEDLSEIQRKRIVKFIIFLNPDAEIPEDISTLDWTPLWEKWRTLGNLKLPTTATKIEQIIQEIQI